MLGGKYIHVFCLSMMVAILGHKRELSRRKVERNVGIYYIWGFVFFGVCVCFLPMLRRINPAAIGTFSAQPIG